MYRYFFGAEGRRYCYSSEPTVRCRYAEQPPDWLAGLAHAAPEDGVDLHGLDLARVFRNAHRRGIADLDEPKRCHSCGAELELVGYGAWIEAPLEQVQAEAERLGLPPMRSPRLPGSFRYFAAKRGRDGSIQWARESAAVDRDAARAPLVAGGAS